VSPVALTREWHTSEESVNRIIVVGSLRSIVMDQIRPFKEAAISANAMSLESV
jgi:hypothetical protein